MTLDGFFAFQVAGASAVSIRSPGKGAEIVANGDNREGTGKGCAANLVFVSESECGRLRCGCGDFQMTLEQRRGHDMEVRPLGK